MACRYTYQGKTYEAHEFDDVLRAMAPMEAAKFMPTVKSMPSAPLISDTKAWASLALKRAIMMAVEGGHDKIAIITGQQAADLYDLSKSIGSINATKTIAGDYAVRASDLDGRMVVDDVYTAEKLPDVVGKEIADKIIKDATDDKDASGRRKTARYEGLDLKVGGEGMRAFYDQIIPQVARDVLKKLGGGSIEKIQIGTPEWGVFDRDGDPLETGFSRREKAEAVAKGYPGSMVKNEGGEEQPGFSITPSMREKVASGVPLFSKTRSQPASEPYVEDLYGQPVDTQPAEPGVSRNAQRKPRVRDTDAPEGIYHINTVVAIERKQKLGAKRITNAAELAAATAHLRKSAVERFDGVVTDAKGKPLAIVGSFKGAVAQAAVYPSTVIAEAVRVPGAARIWFSHNHPSGTPELSAADRNLYKTLANAFRGSGIEPQGLIAVGADRFGFTNGDSETGGVIPEVIEGPTVPIYEREFAAGNATGMPVLSSPAIARSAAMGAYDLNKEPGVLLLDSQNRVVAVIPVNAETGKKLRGTGGLNSIFRAISQSNAGAAIIYHAGEYDLNGGGELVSPLLNIGAALNLVDVRPLDAINVKTNESRAEQGLAVAAGPVFSKGRTTGDYGRAYTAEQQEMFKNTGRTVAPQTLIERVKEARSDMWKKMAQGIVDQFRPIRDLGGDAYTLARLSKGSAGAFEALLNYGKLSIVDGAYDADMSGGFIKTIGEPLGAELEDFAWWVASNRAERLAVEDRENLFTRRDIDAGKSLAQGTLPKPYTKRDGTTTVDRAEAYADSLVKFNEFNKNVLDIAEQSGLIDGDARKIWENEFYVPFYRVSEEDGQFMGAKIKGGLARQRAFQELKGGSQKLNSDLLANTMKNWAHLIDASAKNRAAKATLEAAEKMNVALEADAETVRQLGKNIGGKGGTVWFMDGGQQRHFVVGDPYLLAAINSLEYAGLRGPLMDALSATKHWLTVGVTASPAFKVRNLIRDSLQAISVSDLSYNPIANMKDGVKASARDSQTYVSALASGGLIRFGTMMEGNGPERVRRLVQKGVKPSTILDSEAKIKAFYSKTIEPVVDAYNELGNRGEEINRAALYSQLRKQGKSHAEAALLSRDLMDFSMQGTWASIRFLTQVVPFLNARLQGLYKLGRGASEDPRKFAITTGAVAMVSIALMAAYADDDDWKKREDWDRNSNWWFKIGGVAFRIPKPFEIGAIGTLAERGVELFTNDEFTLKRFLSQVNHIMSDNLAMNPVPQAIKPIIDVYANKDAFSGRPIESMGMERLQSEYRYTANTSMVARGASTALNTISRNTIGEESLSPVQIDSMLRGYFGWLGTFIVGGADMLARPLTDEPSRPQADYLKVVTQGIARQLPEPSSKYVSAVYDQAKILEQAYATHRQLIREGKVDDAREFAEDNSDLLRRYRLVERVKGAQSQINRTIREIERSDKDPKTKRDEIQKLRDRQSKIAAEVY